MVKSPLAALTTVTTLTISGGSGSVAFLRAIEVSVSPARLTGTPPWCRCIVNTLASPATMLPGAKLTHAAPAGTSTQVATIDRRLSVTGPPRHASCSIGLVVGVQDRGGVGGGPHPVDDPPGVV